MARKVTDTTRGRVEHKTKRSPSSTAVPPKPLSLSEWESEVRRSLNVPIDPSQPPGAAAERINKKYRELSGKPPPIDHRPRKANESTEPTEVQARSTDALFAANAVIWERSDLSQSALAPFQQAADRAAKLHIAYENAVAFQFIAEAIAECFLWVESIDFGRVTASAQQDLRRALERMDEDERKRTIAGLMAYIGELQTAGVLEATPSDRLARVAKLIGEAAEIVSADATKFVPLFGNRPIDPATGKKPTALEWFDQVWKPRVDAGEVHGADMKRTDPSFYSTLSSTLSRKNQKLTDLLPPSPTGRPRNPGPTDARLERARELNRKRAARWRAAKRNPK